MQKLNILWTTDHKEVSERMILLYAMNSKVKGWWDQVNLIVWGPSAKMIAEDTQIQAEIIELINQGVTLESCKDCSDHYGVSELFEKMGIVVRFMGEPLTEYIKNGEKIITF